MEGVKTQQSSQVAGFVDTGIRKRIPRYDKCIVLAVTTLRSSLSVYIFLCKIIFFLIACFVNSSLGGYFLNSPHIYFVLYVKYFISLCPVPPED
jgi:hypothetical protein